MNIQPKVFGGVAKVTAVKTGGRCLIVLNGQGHPLWIHDANSLPDGTCISKTLPELQEMFPGAEIILREKKRVEKVQAYNPEHAKRAEDEYRRDVQAIEEKGGKLRDTSDVVAPHSESVTVLPSSDARFCPQPVGKGSPEDVFINRVNEAAAQEKFLSYLNLQFAKWSVATGKQKQAIATDIAAVANALLHVWPELETKLHDLKEAATKPRFTL